MNKRLRKKLRKGEFRQYGFESSVGKLKGFWKMVLSHFLQTLTGASQARTLSGLKKIPDLSACRAPDSVGLGLADYLMDLI